MYYQAPADDYALAVVTGPTAEPVSLDLAKQHLRIDHDAEDDLIRAWITAARELCEAHTGRRLVTQTLRLTLPAWPCDSVIRLPVEPVASVTSVAYEDADGDTVTLTSGDYQEWLDHSPPLLSPLSGEVWPTLEYGNIKPIVVTFVAGADVASVPAGVVSAMLLMLGLWDEDRGDTNMLVSKGIPPAAAWLLDSAWTGGYK